MVYLNKGVYKSGPGDPNVLWCQKKNRIYMYTLKTRVMTSGNSAFPSQEYIIL